MTTASPLDPLPGGAHAIGEGTARRKRPWWLLALLALLVIAALILLLSRCGGGDNNGAAGTSAATSGVTASTTPTAPSDTVSPTASPSTSVPPSTSASVSVSPSPSGGATSGSDSGVLTAGGTSLLPLSASATSSASLTNYVGRRVTAKNVEVLSAPAPNGFWVGTSTADRVWVHLLQKGLVRPHPVRAGDHVSFTGSIIANKSGFAQHSGLDTKSGVQQLAAEKAHIQAKKSSIRFK